jgi:hypothetical protein
VNLIQPGPPQAHYRQDERDAEEDFAGFQDPCADESERDRSALLLEHRVEHDIGTYASKS